jgi:hypothetical protein
LDPEHSLDTRTGDCSAAEHNVSFRDASGLPLKTA